MKSRAPPPPPPEPAPRHTARKQEQAVRTEVDLGVSLPDGQHSVLTVDGSKALMDLLVYLCSRYNLNPALHTLELLSREDVLLPFKPNTLLGSLDVSRVRVKDRVWEDKVVRRLAPKAPEKTVRLVVNFQRSQKAVVRVNPLVSLRDLLPVICAKCDLDPGRVLLLSDGRGNQELPLDRSPSQLGLKELYVHHLGPEPVRSRSLSVGPEKNGFLGDSRRSTVSLVSEVRPSTLGQSQSAMDLSTGSHMDLSRGSAWSDGKKRRAPPPPGAWSSDQILGSDRKRKAPAAPRTDSSASATPSLEDSSASATSSLEDSSASSTPTCDSTPVPTPAARTKLAPPTAPPTAAAVRPSRRSVATPTPSLSSSCVSSSVSSSPAPSGSSSTSLDHASLSASTSSITTSSSTSSVRVERSVQPPPVQPPPVQPPPVQPPPHREERHLRRSGVAGEEKESVELRRDVLQNNRHSAVARLPKGEAPSQDLPEEEALSLGSSSSSLPDQGYAASEGMGEVEEAGLVGSSWETRPTSPDETLNVGRGDGGGGGGGRPLGRDASSDSDERCATWGSRQRLMDMSLREHEKDLTAQLNTALEADLEDHNQPLVSMVDLVPITAIDEVLECYGTTVPDTDPKTQGWSTFSTDPNMVGPSGDDRHNRNNNACSRRDLTVADVPVYRPHLTNHILSSYSTSVSQSKITRDAPSRFGLKTFTVVPPKHSSPVGMFAGTMSAGAIKIDERGNMVQTGLGHKSGTSAGSESGAGEGTAKAFWSSSERRDKVNDKYRDQKIVYPVSPETTRNPKRLEDLKNRHAKNREPSLVVQPQEEDNGTEGRKRRESKPILSEEPQPRCEPANRFPPNTQRDLSFLKPTRRTSSQYVASAISRYAKADSEAGTLRTNTAMSFQKGGRSVQVVPRRSTQTFSDPQKVPVGGSGPPGRFASITQETTEGEVGLERGGRLVGSLCFTAVSSKAPDSDRVVSPSPGGRNYSETLQPLGPHGDCSTRQGPAVRKLASQVQGHLDPEPWPEVTVFGPVKKFKQVLSKPVQQEACLHTVLMEAIQTGGKDRLKKSPGALKKAPQAEKDNEKSALLAAIRARGSSGTLKQTRSQAAEELQVFRKEEHPAFLLSNPSLSSPAPPPLHGLPAPAPPQPSQLRPSGTSAADSQGNPAVSREAMLEAIRSGSAVGKLKKITSPVKTLQVNGRLGTIGVGSVTHQ